MTPQIIHTLWFGDALVSPSKAEQRLRFWFNPSREEDAEIGRRFAPALAEAARGAYDPWEREPRGALALAIALDQFPRNIHRATPAAFAHDARALGVARRALDAGHFSALHLLERAFLLMPFQHCENLKCQRAGMEWYERMASEAPPEWEKVTAGFMHYARLHLAIIERFGRFPHRNRILGRESTEAELEYLRSNTESFGQSAGASRA
jgi:uncharacterized protein (DUF924 family)